MKKLLITFILLISLFIVSRAQLNVGCGGSGNTSFNPYSIICAGTTSTGALQNISGLGTSGQVLQSNGSGALPTWNTLSGTTQWTTSGSNIYYNTGKVGIGTSTPTAMLHIGTDTIFAHYALNILNNNSQNNILLKVRDKPGFLEAGNLITHNLFLGLTAGQQYDTTIANRCDNIGIGECLDSLKDATDNIAIGYGTLKSNKHSPHNTAIGTSVLNSFSNTTSYGDNTGVGTDVLFENNTGFQNTGCGSYGLFGVKGSYNSGIGYGVMKCISNYLLGDENTGGGIQSLYQIYNYSYGNTAWGAYTLYSLGSNSSYNTTVGYRAGFYQTSGSRNILIGKNVDAPSLTGSDQLNIGNALYGDLSNKYIAIGGTVIPDKALEVNGDVTIVGGFLYMKDSITPFHYWKGIMTSGSIVWTDTGSATKP